MLHFFFCIQSAEFHILVMDMTFLNTYDFINHKMTSVNNTLEKLGTHCKWIPRVQAPAFNLSKKMLPIDSFISQEHYKECLTLETRELLTFQTLAVIFFFFQTGFKSMQSLRFNLVRLQSHNSFLHPQSC